MAASGDEREEKRIRRCGNSTTCITDLPISIIESIVSLLPVKDAVAVTLALVSGQYWRHLSRSILTRRNIELNQFNWPLSKQYHRLSIFDREAATVERFDSYLKQHQGAKVDSVKFNSDVIFIDWDKFHEWIRWTVAKGVEELHLENGYHKDFPHRFLVGSDNNIKKLKHLVIKKCRIHRDFGATCGFDGFKWLTSLGLHKVRVDNFLLENLSSVCSVLESLTIRKCKIMGCPAGSLLRISAGDRLTELKLINSTTDPYDKCYVEISALNLASLEYIPGSDGFDSVTIKTPRLARVFCRYYSIRNHENLGLPLIQFASCETVHLNIVAEEMPLIRDVPSFENLKQMRLDIDLYRYSDSGERIVDLKDVLNLLRAAPFLEELEVMAYEAYYNGPNSINMHLSAPHHQFTNHHLKTVKMHGFRGNWYETELAVCILENSPKLEMLVIIASYDGLVQVYRGDGKFKSRPRRYIKSQKYDYRADVAVAQEKLKNVKTNARIIFL